MGDAPLGDIIFVCGGGVFDWAAVSGSASDREDYFLASFYPIHSQRYADVFAAVSVSREVLGSNMFWLDG